jgi:hypothetical protein
MADRSEEMRLRAEQSFKRKEEQAKEGEQAWAEHIAAGEAADAHRATLKRMRLAKEAAEAEGRTKPARKGRLKPSK